MSQDVAASSSPENTTIGPTQKRRPCPTCGYDMRGLPDVGNGRACPECGKTTSDAAMASGRVRHPCPKCGYDLHGLPYVGKGRSCPECGTTTSDEDLRRLRLIPPVGRALAWMCVPVFVAAGAVWIIGATRWSLPGGPFAAKLRLVQFVLMGALVMWALVVPPVIATRRSARCGRSPMGTVDETILGYALNLGVPVLAIFISLLVKMILSR